MSVTIQHGEGASVAYLVDDDAPEGEQPAVLDSWRIGKGPAPEWFKGSQ